MEAGVASFTINHTHIDARNSRNIQREPIVQGYTILEKTVVAQDGDTRAIGSIKIFLVPCKRQEQLVPLPFAFGRLLKAKTILTKVFSICARFRDFGDLCFQIPEIGIYAEFCQTRGPKTDEINQIIIILLRYDLA